MGADQDPKQLIDERTERLVLRTLSTESSNPGAARIMMDRSRLVHGDFGVPAHAKVFWAIGTQLRDGKPADVLALHPRLKAVMPWKLLCEMIMGGVDKAEDDLAFMGTMGGAFEQWTQRVRDLSATRKMYAAGKALMQRALQGHLQPGETLLKAAQHLQEIARQSSGSNVATLTQVLAEVGEHFDRVQRGEVEPVLPTGIPALDAVIKGIQATLTIIGAYPGVGKSGLVARIMLNLAQMGRRVGIISMEDPREWVAWRYLANESRVPQIVLQYDRLKGDDARAAGEAFGKVGAYSDNIFIDDRGGLSPAELVLACRDMILNHHCDTVLVDHLGESELEGGPRDRYDLLVGKMLRDLRQVTKDTGKGIVGVTHLKRKEGDGPPRMDDFPNSAAYERMARVAIALRRKPDSDELEAWFLKHQKGKGQGRFVTLRFDGVSAMPTNEEIHPEPPEPPPPSRPYRDISERDLPED